MTAAEAARLFGRTINTPIHWGAGANPPEHPNPGDTYWHVPTGRLLVRGRTRWLVA